MACPPSMSSAGIVVPDANANIAIAIAASEADKHVVAADVLEHYFQLGYTLCAPGAIVTETLYILCQKTQAGYLSPRHHRQAIKRFIVFMSNVAPPPHGDASLIRRAEEVRSGYGCSRSADGLYIALTEQLAEIGPAILLTFDQEPPNQAARHAPTVKVHLLLPSAAP